MQAVAAEFGAELVAAASRHVVEDVDEDEVVGLAVCLDKHVGEGDVVGAPRQRFPPSAGLVDGQDALHEELRAGSLCANAVDECDDMLCHLLGGSVSHHVVDARHEEDGLGTVGSYLVEAVGHAYGVVADDASVHYSAGGAYALLPVFAVLGEAVAQHDDGGAVDAALALKLGNALLVVVAASMAHSAARRGAAAGGAAALGSNIVAAKSDEQDDGKKPTETILQVFIF